MHSAHSQHWNAENDQSHQKPIIQLRLLKRKLTRNRWLIFNLFASCIFIAHFIWLASEVAGASSNSNTLIWVYEHRQRALTFAFGESVTTGGDGNAILKHLLPVGCFKIKNTVPLSSLHNSSLIIVFADKPRKNQEKWFHISISTTCIWFWLYHSWVLFTEL